MKSLAHPASQPYPWFMARLTSFETGIGEPWPLFPVQ